MIYYFAGGDASPKDLETAINVGATNFLISYHYRRNHKRVLEMIRKHGCHVLLDSGAFSAWKNGFEIELEEYIQYIRECGIGKYMSLDVVGDIEKTNYNFYKMVDSGLYPIPVFHMGDDWVHLEKLCKEFPYIAIGGTVGRHEKVRRNFFGELFERFPNHKFHGLGVSSNKLISEFPFFTVDGASWVYGRTFYMLVDENGWKKVPKEEALPPYERLVPNIQFFIKREKEITLQRMNLL